MRKLKLFFACLLMAVLSIGQMWATDVTLNSFGETTSGTSYVETEGSLTDDASNTWKVNGYRVTSDGLIIGKGGANYLKTPNFSGNISSVTVTWSGNADYYLALQTADGSTELEAHANPSSATAYTFDVEGSYTQLRLVGRRASGTKNAAATITSVVVSYGGGSSTPTISADPDEVAFGTKNIYGKASLTGYVDVAVSGSNLKGNITATLNGTDKTKFSLSGAPFVPTAGSASGTLRVSYNVTAEGDYSASVRLSSDADNVDLPITLKVINQEPVEYVKVTSSKTDWSGEYLIVYEPDATTARVWNGVDEVNGYVEATISSGKVTMPEGATPITIASMTGGYSLLVNGGDNDGKYMQNNGNSNGIKFVDEAQANTITYENNAVTITCGGKMFRYNNASGQDKFRYFGGANQVIQLYKKPVASAVTITNPVHGTVAVTKGGNPVTTGTNVAEQSTLNVSIAPVTGYSFTLKAYKTGTPTTVVPIDANGNLTMPDYPITITADETALLAVNITVNDANMGSATLNGGTSTVYVENGGTVNLAVASVANHHEFVNWTATDGITITDATATSTTATVGAAGTITAHFQEQQCTVLDAPTLNGNIVVSYNSATINWNAPANASSYDVTVIRHSDSESIFSGNLNDVTKALSGLDPETQYDYSIMAVGDGSTYCTSGNGVLAGNFTTTALPTAQLTLIDPSGTHAFSGAKTILTPFNLPTTAATCAKTFVGWDADAECATAPTYAKGAEFTFANTTGVTLYAVYADGGEEDETITPSAVAEGDDPHAITINKSGYTLSANKNTGSTAPAWNSGASDVRIYAAGDITLASTSTMTRIVFNLSAQGKKRLAPITASVGTIATQAANDETVTWTGSATSVTFTVGAAADYGSDGSTKAGQLCFSNIDVTVQGEYSNYSTTCVDAPVATPSPTALSNIAAAGTSGTITMTYENVNTANVAVSVWSNEACTEAIEGNWLSATLNSDKNIEYSIAEYNSYASDRSAYIKLTAPETNGATAPDIVKIPVTQVKKDAVFTSLEDLALSDVPANTNVTVSFSNVPIKSIYYYPNNTSENNRKGVVFDIQKAGQDIKIYYNAKVSEEWVAGGKLSGTLTDCPWKIYGGGWQLAPTDWAWSNLTYTAPAAIESLEIRGNATKKTYIDGQAFDHTGLTAWAIYSDTHEEEVTALATWTYDPAKLSEGDTEVTVTATYAEQSDDETVTGLTVNPIPNKTIAEFITAGGTRCYLEGIVGTIENTTYGNFYLTDANNSTIYVYGCLTPEGESKKFADLEVEQGDQIKVIAEAYTNHATKGHEAVNVVFVSKVSAATITIDDINDMVVGDEILLSAIEATITPVAAQSATINYAVTEGTAVTIEEGKIKATAEGEATITASIEAGEGYLAGSTTFTVTVGPAPEPFDGDYFVKVAANSELTAGEYLIVYEGGNVAFNGGLETLDAVSNTVAVTFDHGKIQGTNEVLAATFTIKLAGTIQSKSGYYIGRTGNSNGMNTSEDEAYTNAISIDNNGNAVILASGGAYMRYNSADNQKRFRYFQSSSYTGQKAIQLYKKENAEPVYETVRTDLNEGEYYTMCLDKAVTAVQGGTIWRVVSKSDNTAKPGIILEDVAGTLDAGRPYIFRATADKLEVAYTGAAVSAPLTENNNGLVGSFSQAPITKDVNNYIIYNNMLYLVDSENVSVGANRAYLNMDAVPAYTGAASAPGRRRVVMAVHSEQTATGCENINASETPVKMIINGQMYILRGEKMYDATGKLVK